MENLGRSSHPVSPVLAQRPASPAPGVGWPMLQPQWRAFLEGLNDAVIGVDQDGCCAYANSAAEHLLATKQADLLGQNAGQIITDDDGNHLPLAGAGLPSRRRARFWRNDGNSFQAEFSAHPLFSGYLVTFWDLTAPARPQGDMSGLSGAVAHQLNNILSPILMAAEVLRNRPTAENLEMALGIIEASVLQGAEFVTRVAGGEISAPDAMDSAASKN